MHHQVAGVITRRRNLAKYLPWTANGISIRQLWIPKRNEKEIYKYSGTRIYMIACVPCVCGKRRTRGPGPGFWNHRFMVVKGVLVPVIWAGRDFFCIRRLSWPSPCTESAAHHTLQLAETRRRAGSLMLNPALFMATGRRNKLCCQPACLCCFVAGNCRVANWWLAASTVVRTLWASMD